MTWTKWAALGVCVFGILWAVPWSAGMAAPALKERKGLKKQAREALQKRADALRQQLQGGFERVKIGKGSMSDFLGAVRELYEAEVALARTREAKLAVLENALRILVVCDEQTAQLHQAGIAPLDNVLQAQAARGKVEEQLEKLRNLK